MSAQATEWASRSVDPLLQRALQGRSRQSYGLPDKDGLGHVIVARRGDAVEFRIMVGKTFTSIHVAPEDAVAAADFLRVAAAEPCAASLAELRASFASIFAVAAAVPAIGAAALAMLCEDGLDIVRFDGLAALEAAECCGVCAVPGEVVGAFIAAARASDGDPAVEVTLSGHGWPILSLGSDNASVAEAGGVSNPAGGSVPQGEGE